MRYPTIPTNVPDEIRQWADQLVRLLELRDLNPLNGPLGDGYVVSGTVTTAVTIDLGTNPTAAVVQAVPKLLKDLANRSVINVVLK